MRKKILLILHLPPPLHGASQVGLNIKNSKEINSKYLTEYINLSLSNTYSAIGMLNLLKIFRYIGTIILFIDRLLFFKPHLIYITPNATGLGFLKDSVFILIAKCFINPKKIILHFHNKGVNKYYDRTVYKKLYEFLFKDVNILILSKLLEYDFKRIKSSMNFITCPNGINVEIKNKKNKQFDKLKIIFLSNLIPSKGVFKVLDICKKLIEENIQFECILVGDAEKSIKKRVNNIIKSELKNYVKYLGKKVGIQKYNLLENSNVLLFPTEYKKECFPLVLLEAQAFGLVCITTNEGAISEIVNKETGFIVKDQKISNYVSLLKYLVNNKLDWKKMSQSSKKSYNLNFTFKRFEQRICSIFESLIF